MLDNRTSQKDSIKEIASSLTYSTEDHGTCQF